MWPRTSVHWSCLPCSAQISSETPYQTPRSSVVFMHRFQQKMVPASQAESSRWVGRRSGAEQPRDIASGSSTPPKVASTMMARRVPKVLRFSEREAGITASLGGSTIRPYHARAPPAPVGGADSACGAARRRGAASLGRTWWMPSPRRKTSESGSKCASARDPSASPTSKRPASAAASGSPVAETISAGVKAMKMPWSVWRSMVGGEAGPCEEGVARV
mmetsp:Transcript_37445/g.120733  ORF Transcript_37445/g.120733 Transcript_37445/m.120733 type:complete len:218 (+) Transcript_37445:1107-1760(+)